MECNGSTGTEKYRFAVLKVINNVSDLNCCFESQDDLVIRKLFPHVLRVSFLHVMESRRKHDLLHAFLLQLFGNCAWGDYLATFWRTFGGMLGGFGRGTVRKDTQYTF